MAPKSKKRLSKNENKLLKLEKLQIKDVHCSICQSILVEPVTLPCFHDFCKVCFTGSIENNSLCCPLCRLRIGSWLRTATKQKNLVNTVLWDFLKSKFPKEIDDKLKGEDLILSQEKPLVRLSEPGEIRSEYEAELKRIREERLQLEQKQLKESELLISKLQSEEEEVHKSQLDILKQDEILAKQMQKEYQKKPVPINNTRKQCLRGAVIKTRLKTSKIDVYLSKVQTAKNVSPEIVNKNTATITAPKVNPTKLNNAVSPEIVPGYGKNIKYFLEKKIKNVSSIWNKENGKKGDSLSIHKEIDKPEDNVKTKNVQSLPVSLPYTGILRHKIDSTQNRNLETGSVDSMRQELCYFKPIEGKTPTSFNIMSKGLPLRVPTLRPEQGCSSPQLGSTPSRAQYLEGLCRLRNMSLTHNLPSAFVLALNMLRVKKDRAKCETSTSKMKASTSTSPCATSVKKKISPKNKTQVDGVTKLNPEQSLRRTRSMGSIPKDENETTPKKCKIKDRKVSSERKPYLRSDSKKLNCKKRIRNLPLIPETINNNVNFAVNNLSSPLKNCDVKKILEEQLRIEKIIEQEKNDFELARKVEAEWNGRRQLRGAAVKRQVALGAALRPAKKLKV